LCQSKTFQQKRAVYTKLCSGWKARAAFCHKPVLQPDRLLAVRTIRANCVTTITIRTTTLTFRPAPRLTAWAATALLQSGHGLLQFGFVDTAILIGIDAFQILPHAFRNFFARQFAVLVGIASFEHAGEHFAAGGTALPRPTRLSRTSRFTGLSPEPFRQTGWPQLVRADRSVPVFVEFSECFGGIFDFSRRQRTILIGIECLHQGCHHPLPTGTATAFWSILSKTGGCSSRESQSCE
jgi:hypothetical protein